MSFAQVRLYGNICRDPEQRFLPSNTAVTTFSVAVNRKWKDAQGQTKEEVAFIDCTAFAATAELVSKYYHKGDPILCDGRIKQDTWEDKQGGGKRSKLSVVVEQLHFLPKRDNGNQQQPGDVPDFR